MRLIPTIALILALSAPAAAQQTVAPDKEYDFKLTATEVQAIWNALAKQPWADANPVMMKLQQQWTAQQPKPPDAPAGK